jgi:branched-chain amino acid transport system permease protein
LIGGGIISLIIAILAHALNPFLQHILIYTLWMIYICVAWNILGALRHESLGHTLFLAAGAYTSSMLYLHLAVSPWLGMLAGIGIAVVVALLISLLCFYRGLPPFTFTLLTLAFGFIGLFLVSSSAFLGFTEGLSVRKFGTFPWEYQFVGKLPFFYIILVMTAGIIAIHWLIERSRFGLSLRAVRDNERAAMATGLNVPLIKSMVLALSAGLMAPAGTFWTQYSGWVEPHGVLAPFLAISMALLAMIGGEGKPLGPVIGAGLLVPIGLLLDAKLGGLYPGSSVLLYGLIVILVIRFMPEGIVGWLSQQTLLQKIVRRSQGPGEMAR